MFAEIEEASSPPSKPEHTVPVRGQMPPGATSIKGSTPAAGKSGSAVGAAASAAGLKHTGSLQDFFFAGDAEAKDSCSLPCSHFVVANK